MRWALRLGRTMAWVWFYLVPIRRGVALANIRRAMGDSLSDREQRQAVRGCFTTLCLYMIDSLRALRMTPELSRAMVHRHGFDAVDKALQQGRGVIWVGSHFGSMELAGYSQSILDIPVHAIVKTIGWKAAEDLMTAVREKTKVALIPSRRSKEQIRQALRANQVVVFLVDQHMPKHRAIVSTFFGQLASTSPAPVRFALECGSPIFVGHIVRRGLSAEHDFHLEPFAIEKPDAVAADEDEHAATLRHNTQRLNDIQEAWIRKHPDHWLWLHKRWKVQDDPEGWDIPQSLSHLLPASRPFTEVQ